MFHRFIAASDTLFTKEHDDILCVLHLKVISSSPYSESPEYLSTYHFNESVFKSFSLLNVYKMLMLSNIALLSVI